MSKTITEEQFAQALRDLGATSSATAVTTRKLAQHLGARTAYVREKLNDSLWDGWKRRENPPFGHRSNGGPSYWWRTSA